MVRARSHGSGDEPLLPLTEQMADIALLIVGMILGALAFSLVVGRYRARRLAKLDRPPRGRDRRLHGPGFHPLPGSRPEVLDRAAPDADRRGRGQGNDRPAHRSPESPCLPPVPRDRDRARQSLRPAARRRAHRHRPLQAGERHAWPRGRRRRAAPRGGPAPLEHSRGRRARSVRRRGVPARHARDRHRRRACLRREHPSRGRAGNRPGRPACGHDRDDHHDQHRRGRSVRGREPGRGPAAAPGRRRAVRCEGLRARPGPGLHPRGRRRGPDQGDDQRRRANAGDGGRTGRRSRRPTSISSMRCASGPAGRAEHRR